MLATLTTEVPTGPSWIFEEKYDGIRALAYRIKKKVRLRSRNELDLTAGFPDVASAVAALPGGDLVLDGARARFYAGNGVVADSSAEAELAETQLKLQALLAAVVRP